MGKGEKKLLLPSPRPSPSQVLLGADPGLECVRVVVVAVVEDDGEAATGAALGGLTQVVRLGQRGDGHGDGGGVALGGREKGQGGYFRAREGKEAGEKVHRTECPQKQSTLPTHISQNATS